MLITSFLYLHGTDPDLFGNPYAEAYEHLAG